MKIIVCIKQVPESPTFEIEAGWVRIKREGVPSVVNPLDLHALEGGLGLRKRHGGEVIAISMGPPQCEEGAICSVGLFGVGGGPPDRTEGEGGAVYDFARG